MTDHTRFALALGLAAMALPAAASGMHLQAVHTDQVVAIDGVAADTAWAAAPALTVPVNELPYKPNNGYPGITSTDITLQALYDDTHVYFLMRWPDPTPSLARFPWVKQENGGWRILSNKDNTGHGNTYYEDKVAFLWNINTRGFKKKGCDISCHMAENGVLQGVKDKSPGRHFTRKPGETLDAWHWKSVRSNPNYQTDDQYFNADRHDVSKKWGRHNDHKTGGGYYSNANADKTAPAWMPAKETVSTQYWILDAEKVAFVDTFQPGDRVAGIVTAPFEGPRADLNTRGEWKSGEWTLEIKRRLTTEGKGSAEHDVQFANLDKPYYFGVTVFDNSQINHIYHKKAIKMTFE